jgi:hypothetical protein
MWLCSARANVSLRSDTRGPRTAEHGAALKSQQSSTAELDLDSPPYGDLRSDSTRIGFTCRH